MLNVKVEQRANVKFLVKLDKTATDTYDLLRIVYGDDSLSRTQVFEGLKKFKEGSDWRRSPSWSSSHIENVKKIREIIRKNRYLSIRAIAELENIDKETVGQILHGSLQIKKIYAKMVPKLLTPKQKETRLNICVSILENIENYPKFLENVITCEELWFSQYDPETKRQSMH